MADRTTDFTGTDRMIPVTLGPEVNINHRTYVVLGGICMGLGVIAMVLNLIVVAYNFRQISALFPFLNSSLASSDFLTGLGAVLAGVYLVSFGHETLESSRINIIYATFSFCTLSIRISAFYTPIIAIVRSLNIAIPLTVIPLTLLKVIMGSYTLLWVGIVVAELMISGAQSEKSLAVNFLWTFSSGVETLNQLLAAIFNIEEKDKGAVWISVDFFLIFATQIIPSIVTFISALHQIFSLKRMMLASNNRSVEMKQEISRTVFLLTTVFFICNTVSIGELAFTADSKSQDGRYLTSFTIAYVFPFLNSAINPMIMIWRCRALRNTVLVFLRVPWGRTEDATPRRMENPKTNKSGLTLSQGQEVGCARLQGNDSNNSSSGSSSNIIGASQF